MTVNFTVPVADYFMYISQLNNPSLGYNSSIFAYSASITTTESVVQPGGGTYTFLDNAEKLVIVSDSADDTFGGAGAGSLFIRGLDANHNNQSEVIVLNGLTPVTTVNSYLRFFSALVITSGTGDPLTDANQGDITITSAVSEAAQGFITTHEGTTHNGNFTVPAGYNAYFTGIIASLGAGKSVTMKWKARTGPTNDYAFISGYKFEVYQTTFCCEIRDLKAIPEKTDLVLTAVTTLPSTVATGIRIGMQLLRNDHIPGDGHQRS